MSEEQTETSKDVRQRVRALLALAERRNETTKKRLSDHHFVTASKLRSLGYEDALRDVLRIIDEY